MGRPKKNIIGETFGWWTVIEKTEKTTRSGSYWLCRCKCGTERIVFNGSLRCGESKGCGCSRLINNRRDKFFRSKFKINENGCWDWVGHRDCHGYSRFGRKTKGHRYSYEKFKGEIPDNLSVCHTCDNKGCVNPDHLFLGTTQDNQSDKVNKNRQSKGEDHGRTKLSKKEVSDIRSRLENGEFGTNLAKEYNVTTGLIYHIKHRRIWNHID